MTTTAKSKTRVSFEKDVNAINMPPCMALSDSYIDSNLDWSFAALTPQMVKLLANDRAAFLKRKSEEIEASSRTLAKRMSRTLRRFSSNTTKNLRNNIARSSNGSQMDTALKSVHNWRFNIFEANQLVGGYIMLPVAKIIFTHHDLLNKFHIDEKVFDEFIFKVDKHYRKKPFHNSVHATDVMQTVHTIILHSGFLELMNNLEVLCLLTTALCHDIEHTGTNNNFHRNTRSEMAKLYQASILENHHLRVGLAILHQSNLLASLTDAEFEEFKEMMCTMILSTDMANHFLLITNMKIIQCTPSKCSSRIRIRRIMLLLLHTADISNPAKPWDTHKIWVSLLCQEFFDQGEREKKLCLPVSPYCDKQTVNIAASQLGFMQTFTAESFEVLYTLLENDITDAGATFCKAKPWMDCLNENVDSWTKNWSSLKFAQFTDLLSETAKPRKSVMGEPLKKAKKKKRNRCNCCLGPDGRLHSENDFSTAVVD